MENLQEYEIDQKDVVQYHNEEKKQQFVPLQVTTKPLLTAMKVFGLYHESYHISAVSDKSTSNDVQGQRSCMSFHKVYCTIIVALLLLNVLRYIPAFFVGVNFNSDLTVFRVIVFSWFINCFLNSCILYAGCHKKDHFHKFFNYYNRISTDEVARKLNIQTNCLTFRRRMNVWTVIAILMSLSNSGCILYLCLDLESWMSIAFVNPFHAHYVTLGFWAILGVYCSAAWLIPIIFIITMASILKCQMKTVCNSFEKTIEVDGKIAIRKINDFRMKHLQYTKAVALLDLDFNYLYANAYVTGLVIGCFNLYQLINSGDLTTFQIVMYGAWLSSNLLIVFATSVAAAYLNEEAHSPLEHLFDLDIKGGCSGDIEYTAPEKFTFALFILFDIKYYWRGFNIRNTCLMKLFLSRLTGPPIGFTVMNLLTITKELILSVGGLYVTYFFLLIQFKV